MKTYYIYTDSEQYDPFEAESVADALEQTFSARMGSLPRGFRSVAGKGRWLRSHRRGRYRSRESAVLTGLHLSPSRWRLRSWSVWPSIALARPDPGQQLCPASEPHQPFHLASIGTRQNQGGYCCHVPLLHRNLVINEPFKHNSLQLRLTGQFLLQPLTGRATSRGQNQQFPHGWLGWRHGRWCWWRLRRKGRHGRRFGGKWRTWWLGRKIWRRLWRWSRHQRRRCREQGQARERGMSPILVEIKKRACCHQQQAQEQWPTIHLCSAFWMATRAS